MAQAHVERPAHVGHPYKSIHRIVRLLATASFAQPFAVNRSELMGFSKIASVATYHKCIKELDEFGYIHYQPSYHPKLGSQVYWPAALI